MQTKKFVPLLRALALGSLVATTVAVSTVSVVGATTPQTVTTLTDGSPSSLRAAITTANADAAADVITLVQGTYKLTLAAALENANVSGDLDVTQPLTINGAGAGVTIIDATSIGERAFEVLNAGKLTLTNLTITGGNTSVNGGAISTNGAFSITNSTLSENKSTGAGKGGGAIYFASSGGLALIDSSTINGNNAIGNGGAVIGSGLPLVIYNTTITANSAVAQSALWNEGGGLGANLWTLDHDTIALNTAASGGAVATVGNGAMALVDTMVVSNTGRQCSDATYNKTGANVVSDNSCGTSTFNLLTLNNADPGLNPLADNGGFTKTLALKFDSPAVNLDTCGSGEFDQRGVPRPTPSQICDVGAYERTVIAASDTALVDTLRTSDIDVFTDDPGADAFTVTSPMHGGSLSIFIGPSHGTAVFVGTHISYVSELG